ncbi:transcriptional regulator [Burkholderia sp. SRS-W-2-2016]|uniref:PhaM family polyhydroxyalkanoate granule multifunctional regulatory protein n=1 Tax=Burkholderia sp. SRS-W-2-2016 TaxID=1926878 RepID=UPI00094B1B61|nr:PhaM family polyhydroxyalkanoate granule multifunctional regulatory protein [Burkholderia sp. SRS-W-2-2016]OLL33500.1 transcriptional regulator [Burkholderia sp. SRS-W-2-2016]
MTDTTGTTPPFPGFPGFPPAEMLDRMWGMMRLSPFGSALTGAQPGGGASPSLSMMSDMMAPLTSVEELDKRITDMRAVEQWLKLNLSMLQSAIQALEVQRATLATLRAFGAFAQSSMAQPAASNAPEPAPAPSSAYSWAKLAQPAAKPAAEPAPAAESAAADSGEQEAPAAPAFDASGWWNLLQSQFNQIAQFAMTQPGMAAAAAGGGTQGGMAASAGSAAADTGAQNPSDAKPAAKRPAAKRAPASGKRAAGEGASGAAPKKAS